MGYRVFTAVSILMFSLAGTAPADATDVMVYKSPTCGCCKKWVEHMRENGFTVKTQDMADVTPYKTRYGVTPELASCHTAVVNGFVIEGQVPAADVKRLLRERPKIVGLSAPGMPAGSPGMDTGHDPYDVLSFDKEGNVAVYAKH